jgi:6-phosphogluconolactonase (cycloisomerase 2 family)
LQAALTFSPELDLYTDGGVLKGNVYTIGFFEDAAGTQLANDDGPNPSSISQFTIGTDGTLTAMNPATAPSGSEPNSVTVDASGKYVYVTNYSDDSVSQYTIGADGTLTPMSPATVEAGLSPSSVVTVSRPH